MSQPIHFAAGTLTILAAEGDAPRRAIMGVAVPYGPTATVADGTKVRFAAGALPIDGKAPKVLMFHDANRPVGVVTERVETPEGMLFTARIAATAAGDEALTLAAEGVIDAVSVGVNPTRYSYDEDGVMVIEAAEWNELSLVPMPAFAGATIEQVAAAEGVSPDPAPIHETDEIPSNVPSESEVTTEMDQTPETAPATVEASQVATTVFAQPRKFAMPTIGEWVSKVLAGGAEAQEFYARVKAAAPDVLTTDTPGILPTPILGPVYNNFMPNWRPLVTAMGVRAMPGGGQVFRRPVVTTHTTIGASNGQNSALDQGTFVVTNNNITKEVFGGYVQLSEEALDWTEPEVLSLIIDDMARIYANATDVYACDQFENAVTQTATLTSATDAKNWAEFVYEAAADILTASNGNLPNVLILDPLYFSNLGALCDNDDRPLFPNLNPYNAFGSLEPTSVQGTAFGLTVVVDKNLVKPGGNNLYVGNSSGFEVYEQQKGAVQVEAADGSLSRFIKFRGYFATFMVDATKFVTRA